MGTQTVEQQDGLEHNRRGKCLRRLRYCSPGTARGARTRRGAGSYVGAPRAVRVPAIYKLTGGWRQFLGLRGSAARGETVGPRHQSVFSHL